MPERLLATLTSVPIKGGLRSQRNLCLATNSLIALFLLLYESKMQESIGYPLSAIVSLEDLKLALILNAINPKIGGLLIRGPKGSGKTTAVRALAHVLPKIMIVKDCPFNCSPEDPINMCERCASRYAKNGKPSFGERMMRIVELPLGATEDRVVGSLDVEKAIKMGVQALEPGILAGANQNILYVDEINLLPDHIADDLLDAAATGWNVVEREGISVKHPSRFIFVGTMNPEEGQLRPQLLDRLPLSVEVQRISDTKDRIEVVKRNMGFEADPETFIKNYSAQEEELKNRIIQARKILPQVKIGDKLIRIICELCLELKVDGMRPDIVIAKAARTIAAFENKTEVVPEHILKAADLALNHRTREGGFLEPATAQEIRESLENKLKEAKAHEDKSSQIESAGKKENKDERSSGEEKRRIFPSIGFRKLSNREKDMGKAKKSGEPDSESFTERSTNLRKGSFLLDSEIEKGGKSAPLTPSSGLSDVDVTKGTGFIDRIRESKLANLKFRFKPRKISKHAAPNVGKRAEAITAIHRGRTRGWKMPTRKPSDIHFPATIRAAARMQKFRDRPKDAAIALHKEDVREKLRIYRAPMTMVFVLDLSESMLDSVDEIKEVMLKLHTDAYRYRDKVGLVTFKETGAVVAQHPTTNLKLVANRLLKLRMSGFTPLAAGMQKALEVLRESKRRDLSTIPAMIIITDGDANVPLKRDLQTGDIRGFDKLSAAFYKYRYEDEAIKDVLSVSQLIKKEGIHTVVINPLPASPGLLAASGSVTTQMITSITDGTHYETSKGMVKCDETSVGEVSKAILKAQKNISHFHYLSARACLKYETRNS